MIYRWVQGRSTATLCLLELELRAVLNRKQRIIIKVVSIISGSYHNLIMLCHPTTKQAICNPNNTMKINKINIINIYWYWVIVFHIQSIATKSTHLSFCWYCIFSTCNTLFQNKYTVSGSCNACLTCCGINRVFPTANSCQKCIYTSL